MYPTYKTLALAALLLLPVPAAQATTCGLDDRPGATLLLPYFEVDLGDPNGVTTFFSVHNTSPEPVLAQVVLWTDAAYPTLGFTILLEPYALQPINLRDVFGGRVPEVPVAVDPTPCPPPFGFEAFLEAAHTGRASPQLEGQCAGISHGDEIARGYVTVDVVRDCSHSVPTDEAYFSTLVAYDNVLGGDFFFFDPESRKTEGGLLVSLEADPDEFSAGDLTFYGRYTDSAADAREPLPTLWSNRFLGGGVLDIASRSTVWRDTGALPEAFDCPTGPDWYPLPFTEVVSFNEQGEAVFLTTDVVFIQPPVPPFPAATQRGIGFRAYGFGWEILDLNPSPTERSQSYLMELVEADGGASYMRGATPLDSGCSVEGCSVGKTEAGQVCIVGGSGDGPHDLGAGEPISVRVFPKGCFSSSCTLRYRNLCQVSQDEAGLVAEASFCLRDIGGDDACTADCAGGGFADCVLAKGLPDGNYSLRLGDLEVAFSVPSQVPSEGICSAADDMAQP